MVIGYKLSLVKLIYLLVHADGNINQKEIQSGLYAAKCEGISEIDYHTIIESLKKRNPSVLYAEAVEVLKKQPHEIQVRYITWLCLIANADGFMDTAEWQLIYKLYNVELKLPLDEIMKMQKELMVANVRKIVLPAFA